MDIVATSVVERATVTMNVLGKPLRRLVMSRPLNNEVHLSPPASVMCYVVLLNVCVKAIDDISMT